MPLFLRHFVAALVALSVTFGLFYFMQYLISMGMDRAADIQKGRVIEFVRLKRDSELMTRKRQLPKKEKPPEPPPPSARKAALTPHFVDRHRHREGVRLRVACALHQVREEQAAALEGDAEGVRRLPPSSTSRRRRGASGAAPSARRPCGSPPCASCPARSPRARLRAG